MQEGHAVTLDWAVQEVARAREALSLPGAQPEVVAESQRAATSISGALKNTIKYVETGLLSQDPSGLYESLYDIVSGVSAVVIELMESDPKTLREQSTRLGYISQTRILRDRLAIHKIAREQLEVRRSRGESVGSDLEHLHTSFVQICQLFEDLGKSTDKVLRALGHLVPAAPQAPELVKLSPKVPSSRWRSHLQPLLEQLGQMLPCGRSELDLQGEP